MRFPEKHYFIRFILKNTSLFFFCLLKRKKEKKNKGIGEKKEKGWRGEEGRIKKVRKENTERDDWRWERRKKKSEERGRGRWKQGGTWTQSRSYHYMSHPFYSGPHTQKTIHTSFCRNTFQPCSVLLYSC